MKLSVKIDMPVTGAETDAELEAKAKAAQPRLIARMGEAAGKEMWRTLKKSKLGKMVDTSESKFVRETAQEFAKNLSRAERKQVYDDALSQLREQREAARAKR